MLKKGEFPTENVDEDALPKLLVVGIALIGLGLLIANTALVAWFIVRKRFKGTLYITPGLYVDECY